VGSYVTVRRQAESELEYNASTERETGVESAENMIFLYFYKCLVAILYILVFTVHYLR